MDHFPHWLLDFWKLVSLLATVAAAVAACMHALLTKPEPRSTFGWIGVICLFPLGGVLLYWIFGINRVRTRAREMRPAAEPLGNAGVHTDDALVGLTRIGNTLTGRPQLDGNALTSFFNAADVFPAMLQAIGAARQSVWLGTYIFDVDDVGRPFIEALRAAKQRGVDVRVLVDGVGGLYSRPHAVAVLNKLGVPAARFLPPRLIPPRISLNMRNHRKLLVVDGESAFLGGMNIGRREVDSRAGHQMTDVHFRVDGPVAAQLGEVFAGDWQFAAGERLTQQKPQDPQLSAHQEGFGRNCVCRTITDGPDIDLDKLSLIILSALGVARHRVLIMTPYFIPSSELVSALQAAALRGVDVCLVLPARSNLRYVDWATRRWLPLLLERGVKVVLQSAPFSHAKLLVIDSAYSQIGSANFDTRSLRLNFEIALEVFDSGFAVEVADFIDSARRATTPLTLESLSAIPLAAKLRNSLCWLFSPYL